MRGFILIAMIAILSDPLWASELTPVRFGLLEALLPTGSTSSERYTREFEAAVFYAIGENESQLNRCGYKMEVERSYFATDSDASATAAAEKLETDHAWLIFGPRRSDDMLLTSRALKSVGMVSPMANSNAVIKLKPPIFTIYPSAKEMAKAALRAVEKEHYGRRYGVVLDATCPEAADFADGFSSTADSKGFEKPFSLSVSGSEPDLTALIHLLHADEIDFLLLPNNSKLSGFVISKIAPLFPHLKYVGAQGWGDNRYGYLPLYGLSQSAQGLCVRAGVSLPKLEDSTGVHSLDYEWKGETVEPPSTALSAVHVVRVLTHDLCTYRPKTQAAFYHRLSRFRPDHFRIQEPLSIYKLTNGKLNFGYELQ